MVKKLKIWGAIILLLIAIIGLIYWIVPSNVRVKKFGGTATIELKKSEKLVNVTWKESELWLLTRDRHPSDGFDTYNFGEQSKWGVLEGNYIIKEKQE